MSSGHEGSPGLFCGWACFSRTGCSHFREHPFVELAGIEPASFGVEPGLLRAQSVLSFSQPRRSHEQVADRLSHRDVPHSPRGPDCAASLLDEARI